MPSFQVPFNSHSQPLWPACSLLRVQEEAPQRCLDHRKRNQTQSLKINMSSVRISALVLNYCSFTVIEQKYTISSTIISEMWFDSTLEWICQTREMENISKMYVSVFVFWRTRHESLIFLAFLVTPAWFIDFFFNWIAPPPVCCCDHLQWR